MCGNITSGVYVSCDSIRQKKRRRNLYDTKRIRLHRTKYVQNFLTIKFEYGLSVTCLLCFVTSKITNCMYNIH